MSNAESYDGFIIDGAQYAKWSRSIFEEMRNGGVTCVNVTLVYWESARETLSEIGKWNRLFEQNGDLIMQARTADAVSYTHLTLPTKA